MYLDKLDGRIDNEFFDRKAAEFRSEQSRLMRDIQAHQSANRSYVEDGIRLLELAHRAHELFESQPASEKRKLLDFVVSNSSWRAGRLEAEYRQPFDLIASAAFADRLGRTSSGPINSRTLSEVTRRDELEVKEWVDRRVTFDRGV
jgi:hypothetical protein